MVVYELPPDGAVRLSEAFDEPHPNQDSGR
jgi:hypothetical protein